MLVDVLLQNQLFTDKKSFEEVSAGISFRGWRQIQKEDFASQFEE